MIPITFLPFKRFIIQLCFHILIHYILKGSGETIKTLFPLPYLTCITRGVILSYLITHKHWQYNSSEFIITPLLIEVKKILYFLKS